MSLTYAQARDEILTLFRTAWLASGSSAAIPLKYDDVSSDPPADPSWARVTVRHNTGGNDAIGNRLRLRTGVVTVQIFTTFGEGLASADVLGKVAVDAFHGKATSGGAWFRNVRLNEVGQDGKWFQTNVLADFEYNEEV